VDETEFFLPYEEFPWFRNATLAQIFNLQRPHPEHLHWPDLDVDLSLDSLRDPERFPLLARP
jgi:hypothetical protein